MSATKPSRHGRHRDRPATRAGRPARTASFHPAAQRPPAPLGLGPGERVLVTCPAGLVTGGPEALHQLVDALVGLGARAAMAYVAPRPGSAFRDSVTTASTPTAYARYRVPPWLAALPDDPTTVIVLPEVWSAVAAEFRAARVGLWWLSVDNNVVSPLGGYFARPGPRPPVVHLYQSAYARAYLEANGAVAHRLGDYLASVHLATPAPGDRPRRIGFNPKKGFEITMQLMSRSLELGLAAEWVPIANLPPAGVAALLATCRVYVDFGPHPGMDRLPREAALAGCSVVTGRRGAAAYAEDVPIPDRFRVPDEDIDRALSVIAECLDDPATSEAFEPYRTWIRGQRERFLADVGSVFGLPGGPAAHTRGEPAGVGGQV